MPRAPRIEFEGAVYHVMARGNRREPIVLGDDDRQLFVDTFEQSCLMTGWEVFAWTLLDNHYHAVFRTPHGNLVDGMKWLQNTYTRRLNARHKLWGHLFGGRYRSILVENKDCGGSLWRDYLRTVIDYVHLNPGRAGLAGGVDSSLGEYQWSSLGSAYLKPPSKRPEWMAAKETLDLFQCKDTPKGRSDFVARLDQWVRDERGEPAVEESTFADRVSRGWFWGSESFKETLLDFLEFQGERSAGKRSQTNRTYQSSALLKDHSKRQANEILRQAMIHFNLSEQELKTQIRGDKTRAAIATRVFKETTVSQSWIADNLGMKSAPAVCQQIRRFQTTPGKKLPSKIRKWMKVKCF